MTITTGNRNPSDSIQVESIHSSFERNIPQLECKNCGEIFGTGNALKEHIDDHEWGCDEAGHRQR